MDINNRNQDDTNMKPIRIAIVRQKYRLDSGAGRFISRILDWLNNSRLSLNIITREWLDKLNPYVSVHICNPKSIRRISRERDFAYCAKQYWEKNQFDLIQSHERIAGCDIFRAGDGVHRAWLAQRERIIPSYHRYLTKISHYHRYVLIEERKMFHSSKLKKIICNSMMVKHDIMQYYGVSENKLIVIYNSIDQNHFVPAEENQRRVARQNLSIPEHACVLIFIGSSFVRKGLRQTINAIAQTDRYLIVVGQDKNQRYY